MFLLSILLHQPPWVSVCELVGVLFNFATVYCSVCAYLHLRVCQQKNEKSGVSRAAGPVCLEAVQVFQRETKEKQNRDGGGNRSMEGILISAA